ncbi:MAG: hypothetical protein EVJ46_07445 [Candidatus Acididesulfobacter guangdongensis]|uniref:Tyr recombinase domain-containing protein n=1 Tax=Acididesulfobacter guangdongensis TaxID=2597225 RepID=A0A519BFH9_ACIG2|nr:MAG: hypothetical protein EVJ46_07445 [Candidatus Acididesulfobacter guangdongensis]
MRGTVSWQVTEIFKEIKYIGESKHSAKESARLSGAHGSHEIAEKTGIYGITTMDNYRDSVAGFANWAKENFGLKDLTKTESKHVISYLESRIKADVAHKTFQLDKASLNKFETALNAYSKSHNLNRTYNFALNETFKSEHKSLQHADIRAYDKGTVDKLLNNIQDKATSLAVRCALSAGLRKSEILKLSESNLKENNKIEILGGKGGKDRVVSMIHDKSLISDIKAFLKENSLSKFGDAVSGSKINYEIRAVLGDSGSIHALRHNYAIDCINTFEKAGYSRVEAIHATSLELGHNRNEIIEGVYSK